MLTKTEARRNDFMALADTVMETGKAIIVPVDSKAELERIAASFSRWRKREIIQQQEEDATGYVPLQGIVAQKDYRNFNFIVKHDPFMSKVAYDEDGTPLGTVGELRQALLEKRTQEWQEDLPEINVEDL